MDPRLEAWLREHCGPLNYGDQDENGVDLSLIRSNLKLTPLQRIELHDSCLRDALRLREIARKQLGIQLPALR